MRRWLYVAKDIKCWMKLDDDEMIIPVNQLVRKGDKVLVYKSSPHNLFSHIFRVKEDTYKSDDNYQMHLHDKVELENPVTLKELKSHDALRNWQNYFKKSFYKVPLCNWGQIIGYILEKNPDVLEPFVSQGCYGPHNEGFPLNHKKDLLNFIKYLNNKDFSFFNEEETKYRIILPLLYYLGWNIYDLRQVYPEYPVKHSTQKVDYLLTDHKANQIFIEAKKPNVELDDVKCQLIRYCASKNVDLGVLTNGIQWRFYNLDYHDHNLGAIKNWENDEIDLQQDNPEHILKKLLEIFWNGKTTTKENFYGNKSLEQILSEVKNIKANRKPFFNESAVKQVIVLPILENLGWDVNSNFIFDSHVNSKKIDYVLEKGKYRVFIEVKALSDDLEIYDVLERHEDHLLKYGDASGLDFGVLSNGEIWKFYHLKTRDRIKVKISEEPLKQSIEELKALLSIESVKSGNHIKYLEKRA